MPLISMVWKTATGRSCSLAQVDVMATRPKLQPDSVASGSLSEGRRHLGTNGRAVVVVLLETDVL